MSLTTYREVCNELLNGLDELQDPRYPFPGYITAAMDRARELLAQPALAEPPVFALQRTQPPHPTPARLRHCPTHGQQPPEAWGCPECLRELRKELAALRTLPADGPSIEQLGPLITWLTDQCCQAANAGRCADAGMLLWASQVVAERVDEDALDTALPADGEVGELVDFLERLGSDHDIRGLRAAELLQQQAAELATLRQQQAAPVPVSERPWENEPRWLDPDGECWWCPPDGPAYWSMVNPAMVYGGWLLPANAIPAPLEDRHHG